jgi:hypothetical protein
MALSRQKYYPSHFILLHAYAALRKSSPRQKSCVAKSRAWPKVVRGQKSCVAEQRSEAAAGDGDFDLMRIVAVDLARRDLALAAGLWGRFAIARPPTAR